MNLKFLHFKYNHQNRCSPRIKLRLRWGWGIVATISIYYASNNNAEDDVLVTSGDDKDNVWLGDDEGSAAIWKMAETTFIHSVAD